MAYIPMNDIRTLWNETPDKDWDSFLQTVEQHNGESNGISQNLINMLRPEVQDLEQSGTPFPDSPDQLLQVLNQNLGKYEQQDEDFDDTMY